MAKKLNILMTCIGRRVGLMQAFRRAMDALGIDGKVFGADWSPLAPGSSWPTGGSWSRA